MTSRQKRQSPPPKSAPLDREYEQRLWLAEQIEKLTTSFPTITPSEWAETTRWLPPSVSNSPGYYSFDRTPYLREIVDCLGVESPIREIGVMKGGQVGCTTAAENGAGYVIDHVASAPVLWVTADQDLATQRLQSSILPMIQASGLSHKIRSTDEQNSRKTGKTDKKLEWIGGGSLRPIGAQSASKFRQESARYLIADEVDAWPENVGRDGDPLQLAFGRTVAFEDSRKVLYISTPLIKGSSRIERQFLRGDQRRYFCRCLNCEHPQVLRWRREDPETGVVSGIVWDLHPETKLLVPGSVRYLCEKCGHPHKNEDKTKLLSPDYGAEWRPTAVPVHPSIRSYHVPSLLSPVGMQSWESGVMQWLAAWDVENARPKDTGLLQVQYNSYFGEPYEIRGEKLRFEEVSAIRRHSFRFGEIPNRWAAEFLGSRIQVLTCSVDVQANDLAVAVFGWTRGRRAVLVDYWRFEGPTENLDEPKTWGRLKELFIKQVYTSDDGRSYPIGLMLVDSGYGLRTDVVYRFVQQFSQRVLAIKGESSLHKAASARPFHRMQTPLGERAFGISVDRYKERLHGDLKLGWSGHGMAPEGSFHAPLDVRDDQLKELTVERRVEEVDPKTRQRRGWKWIRPSGARNELWDLLIYSSAGLDMLAWDYCRGSLELEQVVWPAFWDWTERGAFFRAATQAA